MQNKFVFVPASRKKLSFCNLFVIYMAYHLDAEATLYLVQNCQIKKPEGLEKKEVKAE